jgi:hypothetical protein
MSITRAVSSPPHQFCVPMRHRKLMASNNETSRQPQQSLSPTELLSPRPRGSTSSREPHSPTQTLTPSSYDGSSMTVPPSPTISNNSVHFATSKNLRDNNPEMMSDGQVSFVDTEPDEPEKGQEKYNGARPLNSLPFKAYFFFTEFCLSALESLAQTAAKERGRLRVRQRKAGGRRCGEAADPRITLRPTCKARARPEL